MGAFLENEQIFIGKVFLFILLGHGIKASRVIKETSFCVWHTNFRLIIHWSEGGMEGGVGGNQNYFSFLGKYTFFPFPFEWEEKNVFFLSRQVHWTTKFLARLSFEWNFFCKYFLASSLSLRVYFISQNSKWQDKETWSRSVSSSTHCLIIIMADKE